MKMMQGSYGRAGGDLEALGIAEPAGYSNIYYDDTGNPIGLNESSGVYERISSPAPRAKTGPQTVVNLGDQKGLTEEQKALAKNRVSKYSDIQERSLSAQNQLDSINQMRAIDLETGFGTEFKTTAAQVINALGGDGESLLDVDIADVQKFNSVAKKQVIDIMAGQKGPQTDQDAARIEATLARTENTPEANAYIQNATEALANRQIEQDLFWTDYLESNDGSLKGVDKAWNKYKQQTPMVSDVVKNPDTGLPTFYYQFRNEWRHKYDDEDLVEAWRELTGGKR